MQFAFENLVFAFQFNEMRLNCHTKPPRLIETSDSIGRESVHESENLSMGIEIDGLIFPLTSVTNREQGTRASLRAGPARTIFEAAVSAPLQYLIAFFS
jgi:hypothetical protein